MRQLKTGTLTADVQHMGGPTVLTVVAGDTISESLYEQLDSKQKRRFKKVQPSAEANAADLTPDPQ